MTSVRFQLRQSRIDDWSLEGAPTHNDFTVLDHSTMKRAIEIHDSVLDSMSMEGDEAVLSFSHVYIHETEGRPGFGDRTGWSQAAKLHISNGVIDRVFSSWPRDLRDGYLKMAEVLSDNMIPIPLDQTGSIELRLESWDEVVSVRGTRIRLELIGAATFVETIKESASSVKMRGHVPVYGTLENVLDGNVFINTGSEVVEVRTEHETEIWKGKLYPDLSVLESGDCVAAVCKKRPAGGLLAALLYVNSVNVFGVITKTSHDDFEITVTDDPMPAKARAQIIAITSDTAFDRGTRNDLLPGRRVQVFGVELKDGTINAVSVQVYDGKET